jgi:hypothetical protein
VDGLGNVHVVPRHSAAGRGLCSGLGLLGIITELKLQMGVSACLRGASVLLRLKVKLGLRQICTQQQAFKDSCDSIPVGVQPMLSFEQRCYVFVQQSC